MFKYEFMRTAFIVGGILAIIIPLIGVVVVFKGMSMVGDALSHTSLAGITLGIILGVNPLWLAIGLSVVSALVLDYIQRKYPQHKELSIAIVMSLGIGLSALFLNFMHEASNFNTYRIHWFVRRWNCSYFSIHHSPGINLFLQRFLLHCI